MKPARGFTLIEVLVALVIVAFGMGAVLAALASSADSVQRLREKSLAQWIGFNQISTVRLTLQPPRNGSTDGELEFAGASWHWQQQIDDIDVQGIKRITVKVRRAGEDVTDSSESIDWLATTVGFRGDAISAASGEQPDWAGAALTAGGSATPAAGSNTRSPRQDGDAAERARTPEPP